MTPASGKAEGGADMWFRVEVMDGNGQIVAIESESLAGRDIGESEEETIKKSILNLCGFIGWHPEFVPTPAANGPGEAVLSDLAVDQMLDAILRAAGSGLKYYTLPKSRDDMRTAMRAALASTPQPGMVTVPREPTEEMLDAACDWSLKKYGQGVGNDGAIGCWQAMLDAALRSGGRETSGE